MATEFLKNIMQRDALEDETSRPILTERWKNHNPHPNHSPHWESGHHAGDCQKHQPWELIRQIIQGLSPQQILDAFLETIIKVFDAQAGGILVYERTKGKLLVESASPLFSGIEVVEASVLQAMKNGILHLDNHPFYAQQGSLLSVPIGYHLGNTVGALVLEQQDPEALPLVVGECSCLSRWTELLESVLIQCRHVKEQEQRANTVKLGMFIGESKLMKKVYADIRRVAEYDTTVYIRGESGTGKELTALALHKMSLRCNAPFVDVNCAAIPKELAESEFFGYEAGAFTGASQRKIGKFEQANGGTLFLDEIGDLSPNIQAKLLRAIQEKKIYRIGGKKAIPLDVRLVVATNRDLMEETRKGNFREDLYYRFNVFPIILPPLRQRTEDIPALAHHFLKSFSSKCSCFSEEAIQAMVQHTWPGNVRELKNTIERAAIYHDGSTPVPAKFLFLKRPAELVSSRERLAIDTYQTLEEKVQDVEKKEIAEMLKRWNWHKTNVAKELGVTRKTLDRKIRKYSLKKSSLLSER